MNTIYGMLSIVLFPLFPLINGEYGWKDTVWEDHKECRLEEAYLEDEDLCEINMNLKNLEDKDLLLPNLYRRQDDGRRRQKEIKS